MVDPVCVGYTAPVRAGAFSTGAAGRESGSADRSGGCHVVITRSHSGTVALLTGELETSCAWDIEKVLDDELRAHPRAVEVSLDGLTFIDSSGLRVLLLVQRNAQRLDVPLRFVRAVGAVRRTLEFSKAFDYLGIDR